MAALNTFKTHPSVRIKGTENVYNPVQCVDTACQNKSPHMHCPFCPKIESFHDPLILKAHYRVKHVDKGIEFAGLKILRCCEQCDMVGAIKGEKKFKGAHWHCYRCRNGFNRRDEAIKHYKTHFRNPQTTFQIQISQEVNPVPQYETSFDEDFTVRSTIPSNVHSNHLIETAEAYVEDTKDSLLVGKDFSDVNAQTIMIIEEHPDGSLHHETARAIAEFATPATDSLQFAALLDERARLEKTIEELTKKNELLVIEKNEIKETLAVENEQLKLQIAVQADEISNYQKREQELLNQLNVPLDDKTQELTNQLQQSHQELLRNHVVQIRRTYLQQLQNGSLQISNDESTPPITMQYTMCLPSSNCESEETNVQTETWEITANVQQDDFHNADNDSSYSATVEEDEAKSNMVIVTDEDKNMTLQKTVISDFVITRDNKADRPCKIRKTHHESLDHEDSHSHSDN